LAHVDAAALSLGVVVADVPLGTVDKQIQPGRQGYAALEAQIVSLSPILQGAGGGTKSVNGAAIRWPTGQLHGSSCRESSCR